MVSIACQVAKRLFAIGERRFFVESMDEESNGRVVKKQLKCAISSCFDMGSICCKECTIKNCRYKCDFIDREVCEHEYIE
jgi:uncharacterized protein YutE (UPF0331/DUF86 family)